MATTRKGLTPYKAKNGGVYTGGRERALVSNGYATALGAGDPIYVSNGLIRVATNTSTADDALTNPGRTYGVFVGAKYVDVNSGQPVETSYLAAATSSKGGSNLEGETQILGFYVPSNAYTFLAIADASVSALQSGALCPVSVGTPSATTKRSVSRIKAAVASAGLDHMVRIVGFPNISGTRPDDANTVVEVEFALPGNPW